MLRPRVLILCTVCGRDNFRGPKNPAADDVVLCTGCGTQSRYGDLEGDAVSRAKRLRENRDSGRGFGRR